MTDNRNNRVTSALEELYNNSPTYLV